MAYLDPSGEVDFEGPPGLVPVEQPNRWGQRVAVGHPAHVQAVAGSATAMQQVGQLVFEYRRAVIDNANAGTQPCHIVQQVRTQQVLFLLSHLVLLAFVWRNRRLVGIQIVGLGVICNLLVILVNGGFMPISPDTLVRINPGTTPDQWLAGYHYGHSKDIIVLPENTGLRVLSDILVLPPPFPWPAAFSLGDLLIVFMYYGDSRSARLI